MVIRLDKTLEDAVKEIEPSKEFKAFVVHKEEALIESMDKVVLLYEQARKKLMTYLNKRYAGTSWKKVDLSAERWEYDKFPESALDLVLFLNEAGSNSMYYTEYGAPYRISVWAGKKGFVVGIEQKGKGFDAAAIDQARADPFQMYLLRMKQDELIEANLDKLRSEDMKPEELLRMMLLGGDAPIHNQGNGFNVFRGRKRDVFFDNPSSARVVYMEYRL